MRRPASLAPRWPLAGPVAVALLLAYVAWISKAPPLPPRTSLSSSSASSLSDTHSGLLPQAAWLEEGRGRCGDLGSPVHVFVDRSDPWLAEASELLANDPLFPIGLGESLRFVSEPLSAQLFISSSAGSLIKKSCMHVVIDSSLPETERYWRLQADVANRIRQGLSPGFKVAFIAAWTGSRQPSPAFSRSIDQYSRYGALANSVVFIDASAAGEDFFKNVPNVELHRIANLSDVIHNAVDALLPEFAAHPKRTRYPLGRKLSDYRWIFGAIFEKYLDAYSHWAWVDAHDFAGDLFGPVTQWAADLARFDIVSFTSIDGTVKNDPHVSGYLAILQNTPRGRNLFRQCPSLVGCLINTEMVGGGTDEVHCSDDILRAPGVTAALIEGAWRYPHDVHASVRGIPHLVYSPRNTQAPELLRIPRSHQRSAPAPGLLSLHGITLYSYKRRDKGPWANPSPDFLSNPPAWMPRFPVIELLRDYPDGKHARGYGTMLRDHQGRWWMRPLPTSLLLTRNGTLAGFDIPMAHSRPPVTDFNGDFHSLLHSLGFDAPDNQGPPATKAFDLCC